MSFPTDHNSSSGRRAVVIDAYALKKCNTIINFGDYL